MKFTASSSILLALWFAACATAENSNPLDDAAAGTSSGLAGTPSSSSGASAFGGAGGSASQVGGNNQSGAPSNGGRPATGGGGASTGGNGGAAPAFKAGECAMSPTMELKYQQGSTNPKQISGQIQFTNTADAAVGVEKLKLRYFFTNEETSGFTTQIHDAHANGPSGYQMIAGAALTIVPLTKKLDGADSYFEIGFGAGITLAKGDTGTVNYDLQPKDYNPPDQVQADDYSYNAAAAQFTVWDHIVIYQGETLVWGCLPQAMGGGSAGAGGNPGAAGDSSVPGESGAAGAP